MMQDDSPRGKARDEKLRNFQPGTALSKGRAAVDAMQGGMRLLVEVRTTSKPHENRPSTEGATAFAPFALRRRMLDAAWKDRWVCRHEA